MGGGPAPDSQMPSLQRPLLFLDVDGVLHPTSCLAKETWFLQRCMAQLQRIHRRTQCRIVLSSTWRLSMDQVAILNEQLEARGIQRLGYNDITKEIQSSQPETITRAEVIPNVHECESKQENRMISGSDALIQQLLEALVR